MKISILVVDDETTFLDSVVRVLRLEGYEEITPVSIEEAQAKELESAA